MVIIPEGICISQDQLLDPKGVLNRKEFVRPECDLIADISMKAPDGVPPGVKMLCLF